MAHDVCKSVIGVLGVPLIPCHDKYLGLTCFVGKSKSGCEVLLKSMLQAIPTCVMDFIRLLVSIVNEIHRSGVEILISRSYTSLRGLGYVGIRQMVE
ncbi:hypothetical protein G4B88_028985 [Cannabis sativa]|uniref:Uncharacterized protein n=1 Tax=Cannabis sativa TaxID=3483 RepID=A0A7J6HP55_CANSA|nr:hypothetical protein G4B88_028985 [Cannabis sativa]